MRKSTNFKVTTSQSNRRLQKQYPQLDLKFEFKIEYALPQQKTTSVITVYGSNKYEALGKLFILLGNHEIISLIEFDLDIPISVIDITQENLNS